MNIFNTYDTQQTSSIQEIFGVNAKKRNAVSRAASFTSSGDTISISDEALEAYRNAKNTTSGVEPSRGNINFLDKTADDKKIESQLTSFFNTWFSQKSASNGGAISGDKQISPASGELLPENKKRVEEIEAQIDEIVAASNNSPFNPTASKKVYEKIQPLRQKLNALHALGSEVVVTDDMLEKSASFLQNMENEWSKGMNLGTDAESQFRGAVKQETTSQTNAEEKIRKAKDDILEELLS